MRYRPEPGYRKALRAQPEFKAAMVFTTRYVAGVIRFMALPYRHTGYYIQRIEERGTTIRFRDWGWHFSEYGTVRNPPQRNAYRGVKASGLGWRDGREQL
jgi:hypothetical protein